jgi:membrane protease YdiL (CAAX protease family)
MKRLTPDETRPLSIWRLLPAEAAPAWRWAILAALALAAWIGGVAFLAPSRPTEVSRLLTAVAPHQLWYAMALTLPALLLAWSLVRRDRLLGYASATVLAYVAAWWGSGLLMAAFPSAMEVPFESGRDLLSFVLFRLRFLLPLALAMGAVALLYRPGDGEAAPALGIGDWSVESRSMSMKDKPIRWSRFLVGFYLLVVVLLGLFLQLGAGFEPFTGGGLARLWWAVLVAALVNAAVEEIVYRGFLQPAFIRFGGAGPGLWATGLLFGLLHWGLSVGVLAALPVSLAIGLGSVAWGKAAYETRGLSWPVAAHFLIDIAVMGAYFV